MTNEIVGQALSIAALVLMVTSFQLKKNGQLIIVQTAGTALTAASYLFLAAMSGFWLNAVCVVRNIVFFFQKGGGKASTVSAIVFAAAILALGIMSWQGPLSLLVMLPLSVNTVFMSFGNPQLLRKSIPFTSAAVLSYNICVFTIGGILSEFFIIVSAIVGLIRYRKKPERE